MQAFQTLKLGLRFSYSNWRMWYNYMIVSMDVGQLNEACRALGRIVEENSGKVGAESVDVDVLDRLVDGVTRASGNEDIDGDPNRGRQLFKSVNDLFELTILPRVSSYGIFRAYGRLMTWQEKWTEAIEAYLNAYRNGSAGTMEKSETDLDKWKGAVQEVEEIVELFRNFGPRVEGSNWRFQARSILRIFIGRSKNFEDEAEYSRLRDLQDELRTDDE